MGNAKELAQKVVEKFGTRDPFILSEKLGLQVKYLRQILNQDGFYVEIEGKHFIFIQEDLPQNQKTFVCARELGRYLVSNSNNLLEH